jgi:hypothetical protein
MPTMAEFMKNHIHHVKRLRSNSRLRYECLDCGKRFQILSGVIVDEVAYLTRKEENFPAYLERGARGEL